jgi:hypothetical protein
MGPKLCHLLTKKKYKIEWNENKKKPKSQLKSNIISITTSFIIQLIIN